MLDQSAIDALRHAPIPPKAHLIDGVSCPSDSGEVLEVRRPIDRRC